MDGVVEAHLRMPHRPQHYYLIVPAQGQQLKFVLEATLPLNLPPQQLGGNPAHQSYLLTSLLDLLQRHYLSSQIH